MKVVVDAFGGDYAPQEIVLGCIEAVKRNPDVNLVLAGDKDHLEKEFMHDMYTSDRIEIIHAPDIITNKRSKQRYNNYQCYSFVFCYFHKCIIYNFFLCVHLPILHPFEKLIVELVVN